MATPAHCLVQDQSLNILNNGITPGSKKYVVKENKKGGGLGARKALNDISNSRKPSVHHSVIKDNSINVLSTEKGTTTAVKAKSMKAPEKGKVSGRKALGDLTNSVKPPPPEQMAVMTKKLNAVAEECVPSSLVEEGFLHKHQDCIVAQTKAVDMNYFLKSVGLYKDVPVQVSTRRVLSSSTKMAESNSKYLEMEDMVEPCREIKFPAVQSSPSCRSPLSPKAPYTSWDNTEFSYFSVIESPKMTWPFGSSFIWWPLRRILSDICLLHPLTSYFHQQPVV